MFLFLLRIVDTTLMMDFLHHLIGCSTNSTSFGASHFRTIFDLVKRAALSSSCPVKMTGIDTGLPPREFVLALAAAEPTCKDDSFTQVKPLGLNEYEKEEKPCVLTSRLCELLFKSNILQSEGASKKTQDSVSRDLFKIKLVCVILRGCGDSIVKRSWPLRMHLYLNILQYAMAWKFPSLVEFTLPNDVVLDLEETLQDLLLPSHKS